MRNTLPSVGVGQVTSAAGGGSGVTVVHTGGGGQVVGGGGQVTSAVWICIAMVYMTP